MGQRRKVKREELERMILVWKELRANHYSDIDFFHYSQMQIDKMEDKLDGLTRMEHRNGNL